MIEKYFLDFFQKILTKVDGKFRIKNLLNKQILFKRNLSLHKNYEIFLSFNV